MGVFDKVGRGLVPSGRMAQDRWLYTAALTECVGGSRMRTVTGALVVAIGVALFWWHATMVVASANAPVRALLATATMLVVSVLIVGGGGWITWSSVTSSAAVRTGGWMVLMLSIFTMVGVLVSLHIEYMVGGFDGRPLVADLATVGAGVGFLIGQYDARSLQYQTDMDAERQRFGSLFQNLPNPAVHYRVEDGSVVLLNANDAFEDVFGHSSVSGREAMTSDIVTTDSASTTSSGAPTDTVGTDMDERRLVTDTGFRDFRVIRVPYSDTEGFTILIDVTERKRHLRRLDVLNRVLRHDLRTDANIIAGNVDLLGDSPEVVTIRERALAMAERGRAARHVEEALADTAERRTVDLRELVERRAAALDDATVVTDLADVTVYGSNALGMAIGELLSNAVEHNDSPDPTVRVTIDQADGATIPEDRFVTLEIADDGPGFPKMERRVFTTASETPLQHSSGLGLWMSRWVVEDLGGEIRVADRDPRGAIVRVRLPRVAEPASTSR